MLELLKTIWVLNGILFGIICLIGFVIMTVLVILGLFDGIVEIFESEE